MIESNFNNFNFPEQKVHYTKRTSNWLKSNVDAVISTCTMYSQKRRQPFKQLKRNYEVFNNNIENLDFNYITHPFPFPEELNGGNFNLPASIQPLDILSPNFQLLIGEEGRRPFNPIVRSVNSDSISNREILQKSLYMQALEEDINSLIEGFPQTEEELIDKIKNYSSYTPKDIIESKAQKLLTYMMKHENLNEIFNLGWKDVLIAGEEIYHIQEINKTAKIRRVNPLEVHYFIPNNSNIIDEAERIYEKNYMSVGEIIDEFYEVLTPEQIQDLENKRMGKEVAYNYDDYNYTLDTLPTKGPTIDYVKNDLPFTTNFGSGSTYNDFMNNFSDKTGIPVHRCTWKGMKMVGVLHYLDENGEEMEMIVDETFEEDKNDPNQWVEWFWVNQYYYGVRIGQNMYLPIGPKKNQFREADSLSRCKSGYVGTLYSADNSRNVSLMDRAIPWYFYYIVVWYRTELLLAANHGKIANIDLSLFPDGMTKEQVLYYATALKFRFIDSYQESSKGIRKGILNQSTHDGKIMDLDTSQAIQYNISLLEFLKQSIDDTFGITRQRKGQLVPSDTVGGSERSVVQSSYMTESYFRVHNQTKLRALNCLIKVAQDAIEDGSKSYLYMDEDLNPHFGTIDGREFSNADLQVFITDSAKDQEILEFMKQNIQNGLQNDKLMFYQIADIVGSDSIADLKNKIKNAEMERIKMAQEAEQRQMEMENELRQAEMLLRERELDLKEYEINMNNQTRLATEEMKALAFDEGSNSGDIMGIADLNLRRQEIEMKKQEGERKLSQEKDLKNKELQIKREEMNNKKELENMKLQQIKEQNKNQIELANKKAKLDKEIADKKIQIEKIKAKKAKSSSKKK